MKIIPKNYFWAIPLAAAFLFLLNIFIQEGIDKLALNNKRISYPLISSASNKTPNNVPDQTDITDNTVINDKEADYLPFELRGTITGNPCLAFICNLDTNKQNIYKINETLAGYKIINIASAKVKLEKKGNVKELLLAGKSRRNAADAPVLYAQTDGTMIISRSGIRNKIIPMANELLAKVKILPQPDMASKKLKGFRIDNVPQGSIVDSAGIKNGDIIYSIEGHQLQSMKDAWQMFDKIKTRPRFEVVVLREDKPVTLKYKLGD